VRAPSAPRTAHRVVGYLEEEAVVSYTRYLEEIDAGHTLRTADILHSGGVETDVFVVGCAVGIVPLGVVLGTEMLVADRCEEHEPRGRNRHGRRRGEEWLGQPEVGVVEPPAGVRDRGVHGAAVGLAA